MSKCNLCGTKLISYCPQCVKKSITKRQVEIIRLIARGYTNSAIAKEHGKSEQTIKNMVSSALRRTGAKNRAGLVALMMDKELKIRKDR